MDETRFLVANECEPEEPQQPLTPFVRLNPTLFENDSYIDRITTLSSNQVLISSAPSRPDCEERDGLAWRCPTAAHLAG